MINAGATCSIGLCHPGLLCILCDFMPHPEVNELWTKKSQLDKMKLQCQRDVALGYILSPLGLTPPVCSASGI